jgi:ribosomal protein S10
MDISQLAQRASEPAANPFNIPPEASEFTITSHPDGYSSPWETAVEETHTEMEPVYPRCVELHLSPYQVGLENRLTIFPVEGIHIR